LKLTFEQLPEKDLAEKLFQRHGKGKKKKNPG